MLERSEIRRCLGNGLLPSTSWILRSISGPRATSPGGGDVDVVA